MQQSGWPSLAPYLGSPLEGASPTTIAATFPAAASDAQGNLHVAYVQKNQVHLVRILDDVGEAWTRDGWTTDLDQAVGLGVFGACTRPGIAIDSKNRIYVAFAQTTGPSTPSKLHVVRIADGGLKAWNSDFDQWLSPYLSSELGQGSNLVQPVQLAVDPLDRVYLTVATEDKRIYLSRYDGEHVRIWGAGAWLADFKQGTPIDRGPFPATDPRMAICGSGAVYVAFTQVTDTGVEGVYLSRYTDAGGVEIFDPQQLSGASTTSDLALGQPISQQFADGLALEKQPWAYRPQIAIGPQGHVMVSYFLAEELKQMVFRYAPLAKGPTANAPFVPQYWSLAGWGSYSAPFKETSWPLSPFPTPCNCVNEPRRVAYDSQNRAYVTHLRSTGVYLSRFENDLLEVWDADQGWSNPLIPTAGDPILPSFGGNAFPTLLVDAEDRVYVTAQIGHQLFLSRFDGSSMRTWRGGWSPSLEAPDPIDNQSATVLAQNVALTLGPCGQVFATYTQNGTRVTRYRPFRVLPPEYAPGNPDKPIRRGPPLPLPRDNPGRPQWVPRGPF